MTTPSKDTLQALIARAKTETARVLEARTGLSRWCPQTPTPAQARFLQSTAPEALFGGSAGPGKSSALLMGALAHVDEPQYAALLLRRTYADLSLPGALMDRLADWLRPTAAKWVAETKTWHFPLGGSITFGYLEHEDDKRRYAGFEAQYIGFDEATSFTSTQYLFLQSRLRRCLTNKVAPISRAATNPGGPSHDFFYGRFVNGESRPNGCEFFPALLKDNPHVDVEAYRQALSRLDPTTRAQLELGEWVRDSGGQLHQYDPDRNSVDSLPTLGEWSYALGIDLGTSSKEATTAFVVVAWSDHSAVTYVLMSYAKAGMIPSTIAEDIQALSLEFDFEAVVMDAGGLGAGYIGEIQSRYGIPVHPAQKANKLGYRRLLNGAMVKGHVQLLRGQNEDLEAELLNLQWNSAGTDAQASQPDHCSDALLYAWRASNAHQAEGVTPDTPKVRDNAEYIREQARESRRKAEERSAKRANRRWYER